MSVSMQKWVAEFTGAGRDLGLPRRQELHLHRLRHGGATHDAAYRIRSLADIQKRGAWRAMSIARYSKPARLNEQMAELPPAVRDDVVRRSGDLSRLLLAKLSGA